MRRDARVVLLLTLLAVRGSSSLLLLLSHDTNVCGVRREACVFADVWQSQWIIVLG